MEYRIDQQTLLDEMEQWNRFLGKKTHLIACGGTAMTLLGVKPSTKDIDLMVPNHAEHEHLIQVLGQLGYEQETASGWKRRGGIFRYDLFAGNKIHTTELLESPLLEANHTLLKRYSRLYIGILNPYDLIASKLIRGTEVDFDDSLLLVRADRAIDIERLKRHYDELVSYDVSQHRIGPHIDYFIDLLREEGLL